MKKNKLLIIDGYGLVFRAYYSMTTLVDRKNRPVGAIFGFINMLLTAIDKIEYTHIAIALDSEGPTFRKDIYPEYKNNRPTLPEDLVVQLPIIRDVCKAFNIANIEIKGFEADDIIATIASQFDYNKDETVIITSDKDLMQLVNNNIALYDLKKEQFIYSEQVVEKFGVTPDKVTEVQALIGDASDNIPGVHGIGIKSASVIINEFDNIDNLYENIHAMKKSKRKEYLIDNEENARLSRQLVTLEKNVPGLPELTSFIKQDFIQEELFVFLNEYSFDSIVNKVIKKFNIELPKQKPEIQKNNIDSIDKLEEFYHDINISGNVVIYSDNNKTQLLSNDKIVEIDHNVISYIQIQSFLIDVAQKKDILKIFFNAKDYFHQFKNIESFDDIMVMSYILNSGLHDHEFETLKSYYSDFKEEGFEAYTIKKIYDNLMAEIFKRKLNTIYYKLEKPLIKLFYSMEATGVKIDKSLLDSLTIEFYQQGIALETEIFEILGYKFNLNSPKEMGNILFEQLAINIDGKPAKKSKNGSYSTNADILKGLHYNDKPIGDMILKYRTINKLISTYTKALPQQINAETGRVHTNFSNAKVITGRISSNNPNLQNIPNSNILGNKIRSAFIAKEGHVLISADYSQIELRLLAELADIDSLQTAFKNNQDIHAITASEIFEVPLEEVTSNLRSKAKAINFGIIYGISSFGLAQQLDISRSDAKKYITHYLETYQGISDFIEKCKIKAKQDNKIVTLFNRECHIKNINSSNKIHQSFAERLAVNATIQGSAADIIKKAMLSLFNALNDNKLQSKIILQIHDELILEVPNNEIEFVQKLTKDTMENVVNLSVPLTVKCNVGNNWSEL